MLKKLSLAALVAMGSMSVASATDLSSAIKGVDLKGFMRLRAYYESDKDANTNTATTDSTRWRTTAAFNFTVPVSDELKFHTDFAFNWNIYSAGSTSGSANPLNTHMFVSYAKDGANVMLGKIPVATPVTGSGVGEALGSGVIATYKVNDQLTVAAAGIDAVANIDGGALKFNPKATGSNTYAAAAIFNNDMVNAQLWYFQVKNAIDSDIVLSADIKALKDAGVKIHVDYAQADLDDQNVANSLNVTNIGGTVQGINLNKTQTYLNVNAKYSQDAVCAKIGYAVTGKDGGVVVLDGDAPIASVFSTEQITGIANTTDNNAVYAKVGYNVDKKTNVYAAYTTTDKSGDEIVLGTKYKYTKKFTVSAYYSIYSADLATQTDNNEARLELKYKF